MFIFQREDGWDYTEVVLEKVCDLLMFVYLPTTRIEKQVKILNKGQFT